MDKYYISTDKSQLDIDLISNFLSNHAYWALGRSRQTVEKSISNSLCFGVFETGGNQVGFARVVSDYAIFAWVMDVFILDDHRGKRLGKLLMNTIMAHEELQGLKRWGLGTRDAHGLYEKYGFKPLSKPELMMEFMPASHSDRPA
jgi:N-acetylglutamate synthase-like GNAT family acetyltransferase